VTDSTTHSTDTALAPELVELLPAPGGWVATEDLARTTGRSTQDIHQLLRHAAYQGVLLDGSLLNGRAPGTWHRPDRATLTRHRIVSGPVGCGKTTTLRTLWAIEHDDPTIQTWTCDSIPTLDADTAAGHDRYADGHQASIELLEEARSVIALRSLCSGDSFSASADAPLVIVSVDDAHHLLKDPRAVYLLEGLALLGAAQGVVPRIATTVNTIAVLGSELLWRNLNYPA